MLGVEIGQYRIQRKVAQGGMGVVYEAVHRSGLLRAAVKILFKGFSQDPTHTDRFFKEAKALAKVKHGGLVHLFDLGQLADGTVYLLMEYLDGETLRARLLRQRRLEPEAALRMASQIASALAAVHAHGIIHRDLTPANIMFVHDPRTQIESVKILDFGIAKFVEDDVALTQSGVVVGTPRYMSPEQCLGEQQEPRSDAYSLGILLFESLTGAWPYRAEAASRQAIFDAHVYEKPKSLREEWPDAPVELVALLHELLDKSVAARPEIVDVAKRLDQIRSALFPGTTPHALPQRDQPDPSDITATGAAGAGDAGDAADAADAVPANPHQKLARLSHRLILALGGSAIALGAWLIRDCARKLPSHEPLPGMVYLDGGRFRMGSNAETVAAVEAECVREFGKVCDIEQIRREQPQREITLSAYYMDEREVTVQQYVDWLNLGAIGHRTVPGPDGALFVMLRDRTLVDIHRDCGAIIEKDGAFTVRDKLGSLPITRVTWLGAQLYCSAKGHRLPTEAEWEYAARGRGGRRYPWGDAAPRKDGVSFGRVEPDDCRDLWTMIPGVGLMKQDRTPDGIYDLGGSVGEWVEDAWEDRYPPCGACVNPKVEKRRPDSPFEFRVFRGGNYAFPALFLRSSGRGRLEEDQQKRNIGFRCARSAYQTH